MKVSDYLIEYLVSLGVTDVFGIPGGVILDLLYAFEKDSRISPHLSYHEQGAVFAACGYAQYGHHLGVAYATRGPGFTNLITGLADAYADSIPILCIVAHTGNCVGHARRFEKEQEMDTISMVKHITKYAAVIDTLEDACKTIHIACQEALSGRKGPVFLDFSSDLWNKDLEIEYDYKTQEIQENFSVNEIVKALETAKRPIILVGDGIRQSGAMEEFIAFSKKMQIPVLSSRCSQDVGAVANCYYGYVGSHGIRYSNFIFSKADCVIVLGNRMGFSLESVSFVKALENKKIIRIEIDGSELDRKIPNADGLKCDIKSFLAKFNQLNLLPRNNASWIKTCEKIKNKLSNSDKNVVIENLVEIFRQLDEKVTICTDVGNNEFWVSRAYVESGIKNRILYSKSFGALGCGIPKSVGVAHVTRNPVLCIVGDQGFQINVQELQAIAHDNLPICILVVNNYSSGMIRSREKFRYSEKFVHTTLDSGYGVPNIEGIAKAYGIEYDGSIRKFPSIAEMKIDESVDLNPNLPAGNDFQDMTPSLERKMYEMLQKL